MIFPAEIPRKICLAFMIIIISSKMVLCSLAFIISASKTAIRRIYMLVMRISVVSSDKSADLAKLYILRSFQEAKTYLRATCVGCE